MKSLDKVLLFVVLFLSIMPSFCLACSCAQIDKGELFAKADMVFIGKVMSVEQEGLIRKSVDFNINNILKAPSYAPKYKIKISTAKQSSMCGYPFKEGQSYVVMAKEDARSSFASSLCSGTESIENIIEQFNEIKEGNER